MNSQTTQYLGVKPALQKSRIIKNVPYESNGYLVMHKNSRIDYWIIKAIEDGKVQRVYETNRGENHIRLEQKIFSNRSYSYKILGMSKTNETIIDLDAMPTEDEPTWIYNDCNRPTCVKTTGASNYAYAMQIFEHINNDSYKLKLSNAWSHVDEEEGIRIPYYIEVSENNLGDALTDQGHSIYQGPSSQTYLPNNGMYKVALGMGEWMSDIGTTTDPINGIGNEGCTLSFGTALNRM
ncbi:hypothetical protein, partial [Aquimarina rhabdastrellae]